MPEIEHASPLSKIKTTCNDLSIETFSSPKPSSNNLFGKYETGRLLGCGAFAKVYHARDLKNGESVAIKVIDKKKLQIPTLVENVKREIMIMRRLRHANIVCLHEVLATRTKVYFVMDLVKGGELFAKVAKGRLSEDLSRKYFRQLISAVGYCHSRGIYHRDLKPENLLIDENGDLKVSDFGLSAVKDQLRTDGLLHTLCGTPSYVAPEILNKKGYDGAKVDIWSCGVVLYVLTAGYLPFNEPNLMQMYRKIYKGDFRYPKWMSSELKVFISRLLDTNPKTRMTIDEIKKDPWFCKGLENSSKFSSSQNKCRLDDYDFLESKKPSQEHNSMNAFDIISFSSGLNLSGLFQESREIVEAEERFVSEAPTRDIVERIEGAARAEKLKVSKKGRKKKKETKEVGVELESQNGCFVAKVEISRLTDNLVVVEVARKVGEGCSYNGMWKKKLRPELGDLVYRSDTPEEINLVFTSRSWPGNPDHHLCNKMLQN